MQHSLHNPDTRTLPEGWADHFDSQYYVDLYAEKPRVSFAHPCDLDNQQPSSAPARVKEGVRSTRCLQKPIGPRKNSSASINTIIRETQRNRRATVAQQLYASSGVIPSTGASSPLGFRSSSASLRRPSVSNCPAPEEAACLSSKCSIVSATSSSPLPVSPHIDNHHPRNFFDCTRLAPGTRRMTVNGARPSLMQTSIPVKSDAGAHSYTSTQSFYHPSVSTSVKNSPSPVLISTQECPDTPAQTVQSNKSYSQRPLITILSNNAPDQSSTSSRFYAGKTAESTTYKVSTEDHVLVVPNQVSTQTSSTTTLNMSTLESASPGASGGSKKPRSLPPINTTTPILQPKPIRSLRGISLNLQVQVAGITETPNTEVEPSKNKAKSQLSNLSLRSNSKWKGKQKQVDPPEDMSGAPSVVGTFASSIDNSYILMDSLDQT
ncbi:hypothetical protein JR316_0000778 [Psilocybe cubensis]|uniref:Uncharacterized protein n=1 Tax=Psilocybe cubensis TaxID=181762 RepID=A0ACB8HFL4_PSICU|nr:hypothetical protein JR316_0000778 [Psilocybe cubensis]KAH9486713.1 hypothetical protein JR316_0000778 [Psilocybe cubensis]